MAQAGLKVGFFNDFSGGLNNNQQRQNLRANETPDCLDVDFNARGGFVLRRGFGTTKNTALFSGGYIGGQFATATEYLWGILSDGDLWTWTNAGVYAAAGVASKADMTRRVRGQAWDTKLYFANWVNGGSILMRTWDGAAMVTLTNTANNNYTAPAGGNAPLARLITAHSGHMFWADTVEAGTRYRSRVRWSHPLQPADFADADYFDFNKDDQTNQITALVPFKNILLVFKQRSVWAIYGTDRSNFVPEMISAQAGVYNQEAVSQSENTVYWWSTDGDCYSFDGNTVDQIGERINNVVVEGEVLPGGDHVVCWAENRLFLSLIAGSSRYCFVFDPHVGREGAWTRYSYLPTSMFWWRRNDGTSAFMFMQASNANLFDTENPSQEQDETNGTSVSIEGYYKTAWFSASDTALKKRWKRPTVTVACGDIAVLNVAVYKDFNEADIDRTLLLDIAPVLGGMVWGDPWGSLWSGNDPVYEFARLGSIGRSHAVQLKFFVTGHTSKWWLDSYAIPFLQKGYR